MTFPNHWEVTTKMDKQVHTTRLKECIIAHFPDLEGHRNRRVVVLVFKDDIGSALAKACEYEPEYCDPGMSHTLW